MNTQTQTQIQKKADVSNDTELANQIRNEALLETEEACKQQTDFTYTSLDYSNIDDFIGVYRFSISGNTHHALAYKYKDRMEFYDDGKKSYLEIKHSTITNEVIDSNGNPILEDDGKPKTIKKEVTSRRIEKIHNSFSTKEEREFYKKNIKSLKEENIYIVRTIDPYLTVKNGTINKFDSRGIFDKINKKRKEGDFPLIKYKLQNMFGECYDAFINFISFRYLYPLINPELAFCFYSKNQIGKTRFFECFLSPIFGADNICHEASINKIDDLKFNSAFENKIFTNLNEFSCNDKAVISNFRAQIQSPYIEIQYKGKEKMRNPFFNTFIVSTNEYPSFLMEEGSSNRWIVPDLLKFNQDTNPLFKLGSTLDDFKAEIPAFINYISRLNPTKPQYKDFDKINTVKNYSKFGTEVDWNIVMNKSITAINQKNSNLITRKEKGSDRGTYIKLEQESIEIINIIYNKEMCNNEKNAKHYNRGDIIKLITNLKDDRIKFFKEKRVNDEGLKKKSVICVAFVDEVIQEETPKEVDLVKEMGVDEEHEEKIWLSKLPEELQDTYYCIKKYYYTTKTGQDLVKGIALLRAKIGECTTPEMINQMKMLAVECLTKLNSKTEQV